jgi:hypothetical protein
MANTYVKIGSTVTVGALGSASIDFTSIPTTYTDLKLVCSLRAFTGGVQGVRIKINTASTNLSERQLEGAGSGTPVSSATTQGYVVVGDGTTDTANTFSNCDIYFPNYLSSSNKSWSADYVSENNATAAYAGFTAGLWSQTTAINAISLYATASFGQYSTASLYGIKST